MRRVYALAFIWGWSFLFIKIAVAGLTPPTVAFARVALGLLVMLGAIRSRRLTVGRDPRLWRHFLVMGVLYSAVPFTLLAWGEERITSALTAVLNAATPLFTALATAAVVGERLRPRHMAGLGLGFTGVVVAAGLGAKDLAASSLLGAAAAVGAAACYGLAFAYARRNLAEVDPFVAATGQLVCATAITAPFAVVTTAIEGAVLDPVRVISVLLLGVVGTGIAYVLIYRAIADIGPTRASLVTYLVPVVAVALGVGVLDEPFRLAIVVGGALTLSGIGLLYERPASAAQRRSRGRRVRAR